MEIVKKYSSITNHYDDEFKSYVDSKVPKAEKFVALEKIHGANFSIVVSAIDGNVFGMSRSGIIPEGESFYGHARILDRLGSNAKLLLRSIVSKSEKPVVSIQIVGELFGGSYDGKKSGDSFKIQKGVQYCPHNDFLAFDIIVNYETFHRNGEGIDVRDSEYLDYESFKTMTAEYGIPTVPVIAEGSLDELLSIDVENLESVVYERYGLKKIPRNIVEGIVIRPFNEYRLGNGSRVVFKKKTLKFKEKIREEKPVIEMTDALNSLIDEIDNYLTEPRAEAAISKYPTGEEYFGNVIGEFAKDVKTDYLKDLDETVEKLSDEEKKFFLREMNRKSVTFIKKIIFKL